LVGAFATAARPDLVRGLALLAPALGLVGNLEQRLDDDGRMFTGDGRGFVVEPRVLADGRQLDERALPAQLTVPTLVVHGTGDEVIPHRQSERFFAAMSNARKELWLVPGGDHRLNTVATEIWLRLDRLLGE
ncbi:MAG: YqiA/YcfP family alpha/beta fold hydrolase, partial [Planctomycetota bacterium]